MDRELEPDRIKETIRTAFATVERPGNWALVGSNEGDEPFRVVERFNDKDDWHDINPAFLDEDSSALSWFSDEAFRYFLPAYLVADLDGKLAQASPLFALTHGLDDAMRDEPVNPRRYGARTWMGAMQHRFSVFTRDEARAILEYLRYQADVDEYERERIEQAIRNYWLDRTGEG